MSQTFRIKRGDTSPALRYAIEPVGIDLTAASVSFQMRVRRGAIIADHPAIIESLSPPILRYNWQASDTQTAGNFEGEFRVAYADGSVETFPNVGFISVHVGEDVR